MQIVTTEAATMTTKTNVAYECCLNQIAQTTFDPSICNLN